MNIFSKNRDHDRVARVLPGLRIFMLLLLLPVCANAEIATDGSLGSATSLTGPDFAITSDLGQQMGGNLFHSFQVFNINTGETATFSGPASVANILGRVTGGSVSNVDGAINSSIQGANLYLINPSGVIFGENATLNVSGSFHVSTANYLVLSDGGRFDATTPGNSVLTSAPPSAFGFLGDNPASITQDGLLEVPEGQSLSVVGGDLTITDGFLYAPAGEIMIASVATAGEVVLSEPDLGTDQFSKLGEIKMRHTGGLFSRLHNGMILGNVDASGDPGGKVVIRAGQFELDNASVFADNHGPSDGGSIDVAVRGELKLTNESLISSDAFDTGPAGTLTIASNTLRLESGGGIQLGNFSGQSGGVMNVTATESITIEGISAEEAPLLGDQHSRIISVAFGDGDSGDINIQAQDIVVSDGGQIALEAASGTGNAGTLAIEAGSVQLMDRGEISATTATEGNAGTVVLDVATLELSNGGNISAATAGSGAGGEIRINASASVHITGDDDTGPSGLFSNTFSTGNGGSIHVVTPELSVEDGGAIQAAVATDAALPPATATTQAGTIDLAVNTLNLSDKGQISTQSQNAGQAGNITIAAADEMMVTGADGTFQSGVYSTAESSGNGGNIRISGGLLTMDGGAINVSSFDSGEAGQIDVPVNQIDMTNGAQFSTASGGLGNAGTLKVAAEGAVSVSGENSSGLQTGLYSRAQGGGRGGDIQLSGHSVTVANNGLITAESSGSGDAGNIIVAARDAVTLKNGAITTEAITADGGNIEIKANRLVYLLDSKITTSVGEGFGDGGNIDIDPEFVVLNNSQILANAFGGDGGNITIVTDHFVSSNNSVLDASSELGIDGIIKIVSPDEEIKNKVEELPVEYLDATALLRERCSAQRLTDRSSFTMGGRKGVPVSPNGAGALSSSLSDVLPVRSQPDALSREPAAGEIDFQRANQLLGGFIGAGVWGCKI